ncbi:hypothetical protein Tsubulata_018407 [Turnera subulata]|uniref:Peroxidase n=1 Tax=Turnera subulata TaxID=218843 RepID=A0A9Q0JLK2_9ROSI|nr:hypothetical protein Tsubulata_018407 [Turnera subulata]
MKMSSRGAGLALALISFVLVNLTGECWGQGQPQFGFYKGKCGNNNVESIVRQKVIAKNNTDPTIVAALLRLQFHDCFVNGCDASILLDGNNTEKTAPPNLSVRGYDFIDEIKTALESACQGVVSCADIIVMATRDAVSLSSIKGLGWYPVETGRLDGLVSSAQNVNLPSPSMSIPQAAAAFANKKLSQTDMVYLIGGGHTVGVAHCPLFQYRLYNFQNSSPDPTMNTTLLSKLKNTCPNQNPPTSNPADLDQNPSSAFTVDKSFYQQILWGNGILQVDQEMALDSMTKSTVATIARGTDLSFYLRFGQAMINLGRLTNSRGEIRKSCRAVNPTSSSGFFNLFH